MSSLPAWAIVLFGLVVSFLVVGLFLISSSPTPRRSTAEMPVETLQRLANEGNAKAQNDLGLMYQEGHGVPRDDAEAVKWFWKAADQGNANSQYNLGVMYANGQGLARDYVTAGFSLAAAQGDADAVKQRELLLQKMTPAQIAEVGVLMGR